MDEAIDREVDRRGAPLRRSRRHPGRQRTRTQRRISARAGGPDEGARAVWSDDSAQYGGLGLSFVTYARIMAELSRGWMSLAGVINSHLIMGHIIANHGTDAQKRYFLPEMACGREARRYSA